MTPAPAELSRAVSRLLRHEPWLYELELDDEGWVSLETLLVAIHVAEPTWTGVDRAALERMIAGSSKQRHQIVGGRVRALYGHSLPGRLRKVPGDPPSVLFHGTSPAAVKAVSVTGLSPMGRQWVHLSTDRQTAVQVGSRKSADPVVLRIDAAAAQAAGVRFFIGNEAVWLAEHVPPEYITRVAASTRPGSG